MIFKHEHLSNCVVTVFSVRLHYLTVLHIKAAPKFIFHVTLHSLTIIGVRSKLWNFFSQLPLPLNELAKGKGFSRVQDRFVFNHFWNGYESMSLRGNCLE